MSQPNEDEIVHFALAKSRAEDLQCYLASGRKFQALSDTDLAAKLVEAIREWASQPSETGRLQVASDVHAEYELRGSEPPYKLVDHQGCGKTCG